MNAIFGAGITGKRALRKYGKNNIAFFIDNDKAKDGTSIEDIPVYSFEKVAGDLTGIHVIIACKAYKTIEDQLRKSGFIDYERYGDSGYIDIPDIVLNPYEDPEETNKNWVREEINRQVKEIRADVLFNHVEIETINRCNGICSFCPVNRNSDNREFKKMSYEVFEKIIGELSEMEYGGKIALFSNNEPLLDDRIVDLHKYARKKLPKARMHLCSNGTLMTLDIFKGLMEYLDELIIDNYNYQLKLIPSVQNIKDYCEQHPELKRKVTIILRKPDEVLTNRGGDSPNARKSDAERHTSCLLPYKQLIIRPDGKVSLCCNDALGKCTMGDASVESLKMIWFGEAFMKARQLLLYGRQSYDRCRNCDTVFLC